MIREIHKTTNTMSVLASVIGTMAAVMCVTAMVKAGPVPSFKPSILPFQDVSADGSIVAGSSLNASGNTEAFILSSESFINLGNLGDLPGGIFQSHATSLSFDGSVVVGQGTSASGPEAFRWTAAGGMIGLGDLPGGGFLSTAFGVSADGSIVAGFSETGIGRNTAFRWTSADGLVGLGFLPGRVSSIARAISADGSIVVGFSGNEAFRWTAGPPASMVGLGDLPGGCFDSDASSISSDGRVIVGYGTSLISDPHPEAFRWTADGGMVGLGDLPGGLFFSQAFDASADGSVVVGCGASAQGDDAFIWDASHGMRSLQDVLVNELGLDLGTNRLSAALAISDDGLTIVGSGLDFISPLHPRTITFIARILGAEVEVVDPNPLLLDGMGGLVRDEMQLLSSGRVVGGLAADGVTQVLLRIITSGLGKLHVAISDESGNTQGVGVLRNLSGSVGLTMTSLDVMSKFFGNNQYAGFAVLTAPADFVRPVPNQATDELASQRMIKIKVTLSDGAGNVIASSTKDIQLHRPPVMLLHGLWSDANTWAWPLQADSRFNVFAKNYGGGNRAALDFATNIIMARTGIATAIQGLRSQGGIAVTQANVIGHSMGGLLSRLYAAGANQDYLRNDNFNAGDIHKLITLDSPHLGSPLAGVLVDANNQPTILGQVFTSFGLCTNCGAVLDLRPDRISLPAAALPVHAIVGKGGSDIVGAATTALLPTQLKFVFVVLDFFGVLPDIFPPGLQHDLIVGRLSQEGGLPTGSSQTSVFGLLGSNLGIHTTVTKEGRISDRVVQLLNASVSDSQFAMGFSAVTPAPALTNDAMPLFLALSGGILISSPAPGTIVQPGSVLPVSVQPVGGFVPDRVLIYGGEDVQVAAATPFDVTLNIASSVIGEIRLNAVAIDANNAVAFAPEVALPINISASLTGISIAPATLSLFDFNATGSLQVLGHYTDGVDRDVTSPAMGTTYQSADPTLAGVDANGLVTAQSTGSTTVTATNGAFMATANIVVASSKGDFNGDGIVDLTDFIGLEGCFSGPNTDPGFVLPDVGCRDIFDFDGDTDIDFDDFNAFLAIFTGPLSDCNGNGVLDMLDILQQTSSDCNTNGIPDECESADCNNNGVIDLCDISSGTSQDCNANSIPDECEPDCNNNGVVDSCDIGSGTSQDCNANGIPDECESADCNNNGVADLCDISAGTSQDCNGNSIPDECDISSGTSQDCNANAIPDECDIVGTVLVGVSSPGSGPFLDGIDPATGAQTLIGTLDQNVQGSTGLARDPISGELFAIVVRSGSRPLAKIDPNTALVTIVGDPGLFLADIAFRSDGILFGIAGNTGTPLSGEIFRIDTTNGSLTSTGIVRGSGDGQSIAFQPGTNLLFHFFLLNNPTLEAIDLDTGAVTIVNDTSLSFQELNSMVFFPSGSPLLGADFGTLWSIDPNTGAATVLGSGNDTITGMAFLSFSLDTNINGIPDECEPCGDLDFDGIVNGADFALFLAAFGHSAGDSTFILGADMDGDGIVTFVDFQQWLACFRAFNGTPLANAPIPSDVGDMNADGLINGRDIQAFVGTVTAPDSAGFRSLFVADTNGDGQLDTGDIGEFVGLLLP